MRTSRTTVRFLHPFLLYGFDAPQPAGEYVIDQDEELIEGISWPAYRRIATFIHLPAIHLGVRPNQIMQIDPADLEAALRKDREVSTGNITSETR